MSVHMLKLIFKYHKYKIYVIVIPHKPKRKCPLFFVLFLTFVIQLKKYILSSKLFQLNSLKSLTNKKK